ncbi:hypothetical protein VKT23_002482 [Stygiomarasmius scandens]|uniref:Uncharacterized protein n=1 Tax=Marasmiellus scandens TaxID=2682957 RepID=A0ABR1K416_9AGAR
MIQIPPTSCLSYAHVVSCSVLSPSLELLSSPLVLITLSRYVEASCMFLHLLCFHVTMDLSFLPFSLHLFAITATFWLRAKDFLFLIQNFAATHPIHLSPLSSVYHRRRDYRCRYIHRPIDGWHHALLLSYFHILVTFTLLSLLISWGSWSSWSILVSILPFSFR